MPNKLQRIRIESGSIASDGTATAYSLPVRGKILSIRINYPENGCGFNLLTDELVSQTIVNDLQSSIDMVIYPRTPVCNNSGSENVTYDGTNKIHDAFVVHGRLLVTITDGTEDETLTADVIMEEY